MLKSTLPFFQLAVGAIYLKAKLYLALVYLDDANVYPKSVMEHLGHTSTAVTLLQSFRVLLELSKCLFLKSAVMSLEPGR